MYCDEMIWELHTRFGRHIPILAGYTKRELRGNCKFWYTYIILPMPPLDDPIPRYEPCAVNARGWNLQLSSWQRFVGRLGYPFVAITMATDTTAAIAATPAITKLR